MDDILKDLSTPALIEAIHANLYEYFRFLKQSAKVEFIESDNLIRWHASVPHPWLNGVFCTQAASTNESSIIQDTLSYFKSRNVTKILWWMGQNLSPDAWKQSLLAEDFKYEDTTPGMAMDLTALKPKAQLPVGLQIKQVEDMETLRDWTRIFIRGYQLSDSWETNLHELLTSLKVDLPLRYYLGYLAGEPVATSTLFLAAGVAGIYNVATLPEARKQGLGMALTLKPLYDAYELGYRVGILQSSEAGFGLYRKLGFQKLCNMGHYFWGDETE